MPTINCPFCNQPYDVDPETIGQEVQCAVCNETFFAVMPEENIIKSSSRIASTQQSFTPQRQTPKGYTGAPQRYPQQGYNAPPQGCPQGYPKQGYNAPPQGCPQGYPQQGYNAPPQGYPQQGYGMPQQVFPGGYNYKSRIGYIVLGLFFGTTGIHDFYAGLNTRGFIHFGISLGIIFFAITFTKNTEEALAVSLGLSVLHGVWPLAEIIVVNKDGNGMPMK